MEEAFVDLLLGAPGLSDMGIRAVGWGRHPQGAPVPAIVLIKISGVSTYSDDGDENVARTRIQMNCIAASYPVARTVARIVRAHLTGRKLTHNEVQFLGIYLDNERDIPERGDAPGANTQGQRETDRFAVSIDFTILSRD